MHFYKLKDLDISCQFFLFCPSLKLYRNVATTVVQEKFVYLKQFAAQCVYKVLFENSGYKWDHSRNINMFH